MGFYSFILGLFGVKINFSTPQLDAIIEFTTHGIEVSDKLFVQCQTPEEAVLDAHAILVLTEWDCFKEYDYEKFFGMMQKPA